MGSSNLAKITVIEESTYGTVPASGAFDTVRYTSEGLSGSPQLTESQTIRTDRMSSGQVVVGLDVAGPINTELAKDSVTDLFIKAAMKSSWQTSSAVTVDLTYDASAKTMTRASGSWPSDIVGKVITTTGFASSSGVNNDDFFVSVRTSATVIVVIPKSDITYVNETGSGTTYEIADYINIGSSTVSVDLQKEFTDLTTKAIIYKGCVVNEMTINATYGSICTANFGFMANAQVLADSSGELITNSRTVNDPATSASMNGSIDMPVLGIEDSSFVASGIVVESVNINLNNNNQPKNGIGEAAPLSYDAGTARIQVEMSAYLDDNAWALLGKRTNQTSFKVGFILENSGGLYAFYLPAVQVSFDDPQSGGIDQQIKLNLRGVAKVGSSGESALTISKI